MWTVLSRLLAFEEPGDRAQLFRKSMRKQIDKKASLEPLPLLQQSSIFHKIFGGQSCIEHNGTGIEPDRDHKLDGKQNSDLEPKPLITVDALVNFSLAFEDLIRFNKLAFDLWLKPEWQTEASGTIDFLSELELSPAERLWMHNSTIAVPNWSRLTEPGPWSESGQASFIASFISEARKSFADMLKRGDHVTDEELVKTFFKEGLALWRRLVEQNRSLLPGSFLPHIIVLAEGQTEALVMPTFAKLLGANFDTLGIQVEACGGAKQVVKQYLNWRETTALPIVCILDNDVDESAEIIQDSLRQIDRMVMVSQGEIEDTFSTPVFHKLLNVYLKEHGCLEPITYVELTAGENDRIDTLNRLFRIRGLGNFDKIGFAETVASNLTKADVPGDGKRIVGAILETQNAGIKLRFQ